MSTITLSVPADNPRAVKAAAQFFASLTGEAADRVVDVTQSDAGGFAAAATATDDHREQQQQQQQQQQQDAGQPGGDANTQSTGTVELDENGLPWDHRIHAGTKTRTADGTWKKKRGVDKDTVAKVEAELRAAMAAQPAEVTQEPAQASVPPVRYFMDNSTQQLFTWQEGTEWPGVPDYEELTAEDYAAAEAYYNEQQAAKQVQASAPPPPAGPATTAPPPSTSGAPAPTTTPPPPAGVPAVTNFPEMLKGIQWLKDQKGLQQATIEQVAAKHGFANIALLATRADMVGTVWTDLCASAGV